MTTSLPLQCLACEWLDRSVRQPFADRPVVSACAAFPAGIPEPVLTGADHRVASGGEVDGLVFALLSGNEARLSFEWWERTFGSDRTAPVTAHLKGRHPQESHGNDGVGGALDKLKLASRIKLGAGQRLLSSRKVTGDDAASAVLAHIDGPDGPELRIGVVQDDDARRWSGANKGKTVKLDAAGIAALRANAAAMVESAQRLRKEHKDVTAKMDKADLWDRDPTDPTLFPEDRALISRANALHEGDVQDSGVLASGPWGDLVYETITGDVVDDPIDIRINVRPPNPPDGWQLNADGDALQYNHSTVKKFATAVDDAAGGAEEVSAAAGEDVTPGGEELHHYWTRGEGLAKWSTSAHPWTTLVRHLTKYVGRERAKRMASKWFHEVFGFWPGERKGENPVGPG